jgi:hypothetical protein
MRMHVGARGGEQMMEHFRTLIDTSKQSPENLKAAIGEIVEYAKSVSGQPSTFTTETGGGTQQGANRTAETPYKIGKKYGGMTYLGGPSTDQNSWKR